MRKYPTDFMSSHTTTKIFREKKLELGLNQELIFTQVSVR
jgi:hypothetical protein